MWINRTGTLKVSAIFLTHSMFYLVHFHWFFRAFFMQPNLTYMKQLCAYIMNHVLKHRTVLQNWFQPTQFSRKVPGVIQLISLSMYYDILIHTCMKQDQSYFGQVFYLREDNFGLNCKKNIALKIAYKIFALFTENYPSFILYQSYISTVMFEHKIATDNKSGEI